MSISFDNLWNASSRFLADMELKEYLGQLFVYRDGFSGEESLHRLGRRQRPSRQDFYAVGEDAYHRLVPLDPFVVEEGIDDGLSEGIHVEKPDFLSTILFVSSA